MLMPKNQKSFFATKADLESLLREIESGRQLQYVEAGLFDSPIITPILSLIGAPDLGRMFVGDHNQGPCYLVAERENIIEVRSVPQRRGGIKYAVDQQRNPKTISFRPGGAFGGNCLIDGQVGTIFDTPSSMELWRLFLNIMHRQFAKVQEYYVGKEAGELLVKGWRLTSSVRAPDIYDLKRS